jgi:hypothetical protein
MIPNTVHTCLLRIFKIALLACLPLAGQAQASDTLSIIRQFLQAGNAYKKLPLYLEMELTNSTNFITGAEDTSSTRALFYMQEGASYVHFGEVEQIVNDSMALLVSKKLQRMMLYPDAQPILQQMKTLTGLPGLDSSVAQIVARFTIQQVTTGVNQPVMLLVSKKLLPGSSLSRESIELQYDAKTRNPLKITTLKRTLIPLSKDDYNAFLKRSDMAGKLLSKDDKEYYFIKEQVTAFIYKHISHDGNVKIPVTMANRISRNNKGEFQPAPAYEKFSLTIN